MSKVHFEVIDGVAVITLANPPVNAFSHAVRLQVMAHLGQANRDSAVGAIVLAGQGAMFTAGADIREFGHPAMGADPSLPTLADLIEDNPKPVVAAIHGTCMGGGVEVALGCHYRMAADDAVFALPEVKLGLLPGAGGTQRLPRAVGLELAASIIVSGDPVKAPVLDAAGALARMVPASQLFATALDLARSVSAVRPLPRLRDVEVAHPDAGGFLHALRTAVAARAGVFPAPLRCVDALQAAVRQPLAQGLDTERRLFEALLVSPESRALRHFFFAEREATHVSGLPAGTAVRPVRTVGVIGAGTMGSGIAMNFLNAGLPVTMLETRAEALERGIAAIGKQYAASVRKGKLSEAARADRLALLKGTLDYGDLGDCDLIIEAVFEDMAVKEAVFRKLDEIARPGAILATNTSTLDVDRIAAFTRRPGDVLGLHFFSPANVMKLLEVVRGARTAPDVLATGMAVANTIRKAAVVARVCDGFIGNRMVDPYLAVAMALVEAGAAPEQVDRALEHFGFAMGPFRMADMAGNDIGYAVRKRKMAEDPTLRYAGIGDHLCELERFGQKTGRGWYQYPDGRTAAPDPEVARLLDAYRGAHGIAARGFTDDEIVSRCLLALINEGARLLGDGIAERASDIDIVYIHGYGFPLQHGGPMFHADVLGAHRILHLLTAYRDDPLCDPRIWAAAPLLETLAAQGGSFAQHDRKENP